MVDRILSKVHITSVEMAPVKLRRSLRIKERKAKERKDREEVYDEMWQSLRQQLCEWIDKAARKAESQGRSTILISDIQYAVAQDIIHLPVRQDGRV